jgi:hypothetical protein
MNIEHETVSRWFNYVRAKNDSRFTECFWDTQLKSKAEIIDNIPPDRNGDYYIFGGWYGVLAHLIDDNLITHDIFTIDIDPKCKKIGDTFFIRPYITYVTDDMSKYKYENADVVINTSTEHVSQEEYDDWWNNIPRDTFYAVQGNDLDIPEHIRPCFTLEGFEMKNRCTNITFSSEMKLPGPNNTTYTRFTVMGYKS